MEILQNLNSKQKFTARNLHMCQMYRNNQMERVELVPIRNEKSVLVTKDISFVGVYISFSIVFTVYLYYQ